ncbi:hypothetical protein [Spirosoma aureum]|uniref:hypothetical protein n=1 Tax=Spirosoma aureum TaxID=2692134 RepID=UPI001E3A9EBC|nr:hypothetical protein [Spirosoma aureum]
MPPLGVIYPRAFPPGGTSTGIFISGWRMVRLKGSSPNCLWYIEWPKGGPLPTQVIIDAQRVRSTETTGQQVGYDGYKRIRGRQRLIAVDELGNLLWPPTTMSAPGRHAIGHQPW